MVSRRDVLKMSLLAALGSFRCAEDRTPARPGRKLDKIGLQLYTVREEMERDFEGTLAAVAGVGYEEVEFAGYFERKPKEIRDLLDRLGLDSPSSHVDMPEVPGEWQESIDDALAIGNRYLTCAYIRPEERETLDAYKSIAQLFNQAGNACKESGLQFCYHNHDFEFATLDGKVPYQILLEETDADLVKMQMDLYWITKGGQDPLHYFERYPGRFLSVHVKDMDDTAEGNTTEVGSGIIDFAEIFSHADEAGTVHFFVEQEHFKGSPLEATKVSFDYLRQLEF